VTLAVKVSGERGRNRTFNLLIKSQLLCQLSYAPAQKGRLQNGEHDYNIVHEPRRASKRSI
jgi:hypothetical protein